MACSSSPAHGVAGAVGVVPGWSTSSAATTGRARGHRVRAVRGLHRRAGRTVVSRARAGDAIEELGPRSRVVRVVMCCPVLLTGKWRESLPLILCPSPHARRVGAGALLAMAQWSTEPLRYPEGRRGTYGAGTGSDAGVLVLVLVGVDLRRRTRAPDVGGSQRIPAEDGQRGGERGPRAGEGTEPPGHAVIGRVASQKAGASARRTRSVVSRSPPHATKHAARGRRREPEIAGGFER